MKQPFDDSLNESFKKLNQSIRIKPEYNDKLRKRILFTSMTDGRRKRVNKKSWILVAVAILLLLGSSPFYSTTMASLASKIIPLKIQGGNSSNIDALHTDIVQIVEQAGYNLSSVGTTPNPFTIHIVLLKEEDSLASMKKVLEPKIEKLVYEQGIDQYKLKITEVEEKQERYRKSDTLMDDVGVIISEAFEKYGYSDLAQHATYGITKGFFSNTLGIDMPDHVKEAEEIQKFVVESIDKEDLDIKSVELRYYNAEHRSQDNRWAYIVSNIYEPLAGKSIYSVTGISYKVKDGVTHVSIKMELSDQPDEQVLSEIENAIREYLGSEEIKESIQNDKYEIQLLNKEKESLLQITSSS